MKRFLCVCLTLCLLMVFCLPLSAVKPQHAGIDGFTQAVHACVGTDTPGAAAVLFENGNRILYEGYGYANIDARSLVTAETSFELGELSSLFVLLAVHKQGGQLAKLE